MSKAVLFSIKPKYCELIASGKKTIEVRKTRPKMIDVPFKCYIYCTVNGTTVKEKDKNIFTDLRGKVIGEFVCDRIEEIRVVDTELMRYVTVNDKADMFISEETRLSVDELYDYLWPKKGYGFHISDLVIYDKPKELREFRKFGVCPCGAKPILYCTENMSFCANRNLTMPPQSWGYVEELI